MITAQEANKLSGTKTEVLLEFIEDKIKTATTFGKHEVIIRDNPYSCWLYGNYDKLHKNEKQCLDTIRENGLEVDLYYNEGAFVDMGLQIKW